MQNAHYTASINERTLSAVYHVSSVFPRMIMFIGTKIISVSKQGKPLRSSSLSSNAPPRFSLSFHSGQTISIYRYLSLYALWRTRLSAFQLKMDACVTSSKNRVKMWSYEGLCRKLVTTCSRLVRNRTKYGTADFLEFCAGAYGAEGRMCRGENSI